MRGGTVHVSRDREIRLLPRGLYALVFAFCAAGCTPSIGDKCTLSTDCSLRGDRLCDTSQPGGYCTIFNCAGNSCPDYATCVLFHPSIQGCGYDDRSPSRTGRSFCMASCSGNSECRGGYTCEDPLAAPWNAMILDNNQVKRVCIAVPGARVDDTPDAAVCQTAGPAVPPIDAATRTVDAGVDAAVDAGSDAGVDGGNDVDAGADAR